MKDSSKIFERIVENILECAQGDNISFRKIAEIANLDPATDFVGADLSGMDFRDDDLSGFNFTNADLRSADFRRANLSGTKLEGANLEGAIGFQRETAAEEQETFADRRQLKRLLAAGWWPKIEQVFHIKSLRFGDTPISNIAPLASLPNLSTLSLRNRRIESFEPIGGLLALRTLELSGSNIRSLSQLMSPPRLRYLDVSLTGLEEINGVEQLVSLETLNISSTKIMDLSPLQGSKIRVLDAAMTKIIELSCLSSCRYLEALNIFRTDVKEIDPVSKNQRLRDLHIDGTGIEIFPWRNSFPMLSSLSISNTAISDIHMAVEIPTLRNLVANSVKMDLDQLSRLVSGSKLTTMDAERCSLEGALWIESESIIKRLSISGNSISSVNFKGNSEIVSLDVRGNKIADISFLKRMPAIKFLYLSGNPVENWDEISELRGLRRLAVDSIPTELVQGIVENNPYITVQMHNVAAREIDSKLPDSVEVISILYGDGSGVTRLVARDVGHNIAHSESYPL